MEGMADQIFVWKDYIIGGIMSLVGVGIIRYIGGFLLRKVPKGYLTIIISLILNVAARKSLSGKDKAAKVLDAVLDAVPILKYMPRKIIIAEIKKQYDILKAKKSV